MAWSEWKKFGGCYENILSVTSSTNSVATLTIPSGVTEGLLITCNRQKTIGNNVPPTISSGKIETLHEHHNYVYSTSASVESGVYKISGVKGGETITKTNCVDGANSFTDIIFMY